MCAAPDEKELIELPCQTDPLATLWIPCCSRVCIPNPAMRHRQAPAPHHHQHLLEEIVARTQATMWPPSLPLYPPQATRLSTLTAGSQQAAMQPATAVLPQPRVRQLELELILIRVRIKACLMFTILFKQWTLRTVPALHQLRLLLVQATSPAIQTFPAHRLPVKVAATVAASVATPPVAINLHMICDAKYPPPRVAMNSGAPLLVQVLDNLWVYWLDPLAVPRHCLIKVRHLQAPQHHHRQLHHLHRHRRHLLRLRLPPPLFRRHRQVPHFL